MSIRLWGLRWKPIIESVLHPGDVVKFFLSRRARSVSAFSSLTIAMATLAIVYDGTTSDQVDLNDGGVWVTYLNMADTGRSVAAHLNYPSRTLDSYTEPDVNQFDVSQAANDVAIHDLSGNGVSSVNTATWIAGPRAVLPKGGAATQGGDVVAITDPTAGKVWIVPARTVEAYSADSAPALAKVPGVRAVVGVDGVVHTVTPDGKLRDLRRSAEGTIVDEVGEVPKIGSADRVTLTAVGGTGVVLDHTAGWVGWPGHKATVPGAEQVLAQQPGTAAGVVALSAPNALLEVPLGGGDTKTIGVRSGQPIAPVSVNGCIYAAWTASAEYRRDCSGEADDVAKTYPDRLSRPDARPGQLVFRVNRDVVVINDTGDGDVLLVNEDMLLINDWAAIRSAMDADSKKKTDEVKLTEFHRSKENRPPKPEPDNFGLRAGQTVELPALANDTDPDGDVLLASLAQPKTVLGTVEQVRDGRALRIVVPSDARGSVLVPYVASDGRGGETRSEMNLSVHPPGQNAEPAQVPGRSSELTMVQRGSAEHHILAEWYDPDGDPYWIDHVEFPKGMDGTFRPDGLVKISDDGTQDPGVRTVHVFLTDGRQGSTDAELKVTVKERGKRLPPTANADYARAVVGQQIRVAPLTNDTDPEGDRLALGNVGAVDGGRIAPNGNDGTFTFVATKAGTFYADYAVSDGSSSANGVVRLDVTAPPASQATPIPDSDLAVIPASGQTTVDVLSNDVDPLGGVLVLQSVGQADGVTASVVDHSVLRLEDTGLGDVPVTLTYEVANANGSSTGSVTVLASKGADDGTPVAYPDAANVRSGDVVTVDVLDNDVSPGKQDLTVSPELQVVEGADLGAAFVSENKVRFKAQGKEGTVRIKYTGFDPDQNAATGTLDLTILPVGGTNQAPSPEPAMARLVSGGTAQIRVDLDGIDPDGDSVSLIGLKEAPTKGVVSIDGDTLTYTASAGRDGIGTDTFSYLVEDPFGSQGEGRVEVGIAARPGEDAAPITSSDSVTVRPDRLVSVPVLANDVDPEGEPLALVSGSVEPADDVTKATAKVKNGRVLLRTPKDPGVLRYRYVAADPAGTRSSGSLVVQVSATAPLQPPVARDDVVPVNAIVGKDHVDVDVLENDEDPDGAAQTLTPSSATAGVETLDSGKLRVPVKPERQVLLYQVADEDGNVGQAVVVVPGSASPAAQRPVVRADADLPIKVPAGELATIKVEDYVAVPAGRSASVPFTEDVQPGPGWDGSKKLKDSTTLLYRSVKDFHGPSAMTFLASDAKSKDDQSGHTAVLTLPIEVTASGHTPPDLVLPVIKVTPGEESWSGDLRQYAVDPDPGDSEKLKFQVRDAQEPIVADLSGTTLKVSAPSGTKIGLSRELTLSVTDGENPVDVQARVVVVSSTRPEMTVRPGVIKDANAGEPAKVDVGDYVTNPFESDGKPLRVVGVPTVSGGKAKVSATDGPTFTVTPDADFHGTLRVRYVVADATGSRDRQKQGQVEIQVRGKPDPPTAVVAVATESHTVDVSWRAGANNGAVIDHYRVEWRGGSTGSKEFGAVTSATITGLTNDRNYQFRVVAINEVDESEPSAWSRDARPDQIPPAPGRPVVDFDDNVLHVSWTRVQPDGSPVQNYEVSYGTGSVLVPGGQSSTDLTSLANGQNYSVKVRAINKAETESADGIPGAGPWSAITQEHPNGVPAAPTGVTAVGDPPDADPSAVVSWNAPADNGDPVTAYEVRKNGAVVACAVDVNASRPQCRIPLSVGEDATFTVRARNRTNQYSTGWGNLSAPSNSVRGATTPGAVTNVNAAATGGSTQARITFDPAAKNGAQSISYRYQIVGGPSGSLTSGSTISGFTDGSSRTITVWAISQANGQNSAPGPSGSASVSTFSPCTVSVTRGSENYDNVTFNWSVTPHGRSCTYSSSGSGSGSGSVSGTTSTSRSGSVNVGSGPSQNVSFTLTAHTNTSGSDLPVSNQSASASGSTWVSTIDWGDGGSGCNLFNNCHWASLTVNHFRPNSTIYCWMGGVNAPDWQATYGVDGNGYRFVQHTWQYNAAGPYFPNDYDGTSCRQN